MSNYDLVNERFSPFQILMISLQRLFCLKKSAPLGQRTGHQSLALGLYEIGKTRLISELDCVEVLNKLRIVNILYNLEKAKINKALGDNTELFTIKESYCTNTQKSRYKG